MISTKKKREGHMVFEFDDTSGRNARMKVVGVGGAGGNAVNRMIDEDLEGVEFVAVNTDAMALKKCNAHLKIQIGRKLTHGLGAGARPEIGRQAIAENEEEVRRALEGADLVFITAGMGGGTGTGAAPIVAQLAREAGILTVAVVTKPFPFEGRTRLKIAEQGIEELSEHCDSLITIPNEKVLQVMGPQAPLLDAFARANDVLLNAVQGISELITRPGLINVDFADVRAVMAEMGVAMMGSAVARGNERAVEAARSAVSSPLLEDVNISGAKGILVNVTAGVDMAIGEFEEVGETVRELAADDAKVIIGTVLDPQMQGDLRVTMVATGIGGAKAQSHPYRVVQGSGERRAVNYESLDTPTVIRSRRGSGEAAAAAEAETEPGLEYLDIPAFLRRQAD